MSSEGRKKKIIPEEKDPFFPPYSLQGASMQPGSLHIEINVPLGKQNSATGKRNPSESRRMNYVILKHKEINKMFGCFLYNYFSETYVRNKPLLEIIQCNELV